MSFEEIEKKLKRRRARTKGLTFERWCAEKLRPLFPRVKRHLEFQKEEALGIDLDNTGSYKIQCKKWAAYAPINCLKEVQHCAELGDVPVLITAGDADPPVAVIPLEEFIRLVRVDLAQG